MDREEWEKSSMKMALFFLLFSSLSYAKPVVLLSYFDPFGRASINSSEVVANLLLERAKNHPDFELRPCKLQTVFDKSFYEWEDCLKGLSEEPALVLGLGESNCNLKIEALGRNLDLTHGADNDGNERRSTPIREDGPSAIGFKYPLAKMYCALSAQEKSIVEVSNNAGTFVCNNLSYQVSDKYPELNFGFIHVPANNCRDLNRKTDLSVKALEKMIQAAVKVKTVKRLPTTKQELKILRNSSAEACEAEYYQKLKGVDERKIWPF